MRLPEARLVRGRFCTLGGAPREIVVVQGPLAKAVTQAFAETVPEFGDLLVRGAAIGAGVAAVFDQGEAGRVGPEDMVVAWIERPVEPVPTRGLVHGPSQWVDATVTGADLGTSAPGRLSVSTDGKVSILRIGVVRIAIQPVLTRLRRGDLRMRGHPGMAGRMTVRRAVAAQGRAAGLEGA